MVDIFFLYNTWIIVLTTARWPTVFVCVCVSARGLRKDEGWSYLEGVTVTSKLCHKIATPQRRSRLTDQSRQGSLAVHKIRTGFMVVVFLFYPPSTDAKN